MDENMTYTQTTTNQGYEYSTQNGQLPQFTDNGTPQPGAEKIFNYTVQQFDLNKRVEALEKDNDRLKRQVKKIKEEKVKFYQFIDAADEQEYNEAIQNLKNKQIYETGVTAAYGDQLLTLVTCAYHTDNGRFVVVARKVEN